MDRQEAQDRQDIRARQKRDKERDTNWQLNRVDDIEWAPDKSGVNVLINWDQLTDSVRLDIMAKDVTPLQSFIGDADNVRKAAMRYFADKCRHNWPNSKIQISLEHAAYIGSELERCDTERIDYVQD